MLKRGKIAHSKSKYLEHLNRTLVRMDDTSDTSRLDFSPILGTSLLKASKALEYVHHELRGTQRGTLAYILEWSLFLNSWNSALTP